MPTIIFVTAPGTRKAVLAPAGTSLLEAARRNGVPIPGTCGGSLSCATCHVIVAPQQFDLVGRPNAEEEAMLELAFEIGPTSRLCCQITVTDQLEGLVVTLPSATAAGS